MSYSRYNSQTYVDENGNNVTCDVHRHNAEEKIGRKLEPYEIVHHIDEDKYNNDPSNLLVFRSFGDHARYHSYYIMLDMLDGTFIAPSVYYEHICPECDKPFRSKSIDKVFCSQKCMFNAIMIKDVPPRDKLIYDLKRKTIKQVAKENNVSTVTVNAWCERYNISKKRLVKVKPKKPKPQKKYVNYNSLPIHMVSLVYPYDKLTFRNIYELTKFIKERYHTCENDKCIRKNILRVLNGERKSFHKCTFQSKAYHREKPRAVEFRELSNIAKELGLLEDKNDNNDCSNSD